MDSKHLKQIGAEIDTASRIRKIPVPNIVRDILEFIDFQYHGVVTLPLDDSQPDQFAEGGD